MWEVCASALCFGTLECFASRLPAALGLGRQPKETTVALVSALHAVVVTYQAYCIIVDGAWAAPTSILDSTPSSVRLTLFSAGFFVWDVIVCVRDRYHPSFILHAVVCCLAYLMVNVPRPFAHWYACYFLLNESSSPFLSMRTLLIKAGASHTILFKLVNWVFTLVFIAVRVLIGAPILMGLLFELYWTDYSCTANALVAWFIGMAATSMWVLNVVWMRAILRSVLRPRHHTANKVQ